MKKKDAELDVKIEQVGVVVGRLHVIANEMKKELKIQEMMAQDRARLSFRPSSLLRRTASQPARACTHCLVERAIGVGALDTKAEAQS